MEVAVPSRRLTMVEAWLMSKYEGQQRLKRSETVGDEAGGRSRGAGLM